MTRSENHARRPVSVEPLETRLCLSSPHGGDVPHAAGGGATVLVVAGAVVPQQAAPAAPAPALTLGHHETPAARAPHTMQASHVEPPGLAGRRAAEARMHAIANAVADAVAGMFAAAAQRASALIEIAIKFPPMIGLPSVSAPSFPGAVDDGAARGEPASTPAAQPPQAPAAVQAQTRTAPPPANELLAATADAEPVPIDQGSFTVAAVDTVSGSTVVQALAAPAGSVLDRLTSEWYDGSSAAAAAVETLVTEWLPAQALSAVTLPQAAGELVVPAAQRVASVVAAPVAATYEIVHMGSPFTLLADSLASFIDESAAVSNAVAQTQSRGPWALTVGVIAADLVVLSYVYRRRHTRRGRVALTPVGVA